MIKRILPAYYFGLECVYLYFLLFLFYTRTGKLPPMAATLCVIASGLLFLVFSLKMKKGSKFTPFIGAILSGGIGYFLGLTPMSALICIVFIFFRISAFTKDTALWTEERRKLALTFYCSSFLIFFLGWIFKYPYMNWLFWNVILFTVLFSIGRYLQQTDSNTVNRNPKFLAAFFGIAFLFAAGIASLLLPFAKWLLFNFFKGIILLISFLLAPLFNLVEGKHLQLKVLKGPQDKIAGKEQKPNSVFTDHVVHHVPFWISLIVLAAILIVIWILIKKFKQRNISQSEQPVKLLIEHFPSFEKKGGKSRFFRSSAPQEYMRRLIYQLQLFADRHKMGRHSHETLREWFDRLGFSMDEALFIAYDNVRYGNVILTKIDLKDIEVSIENLKREIKDRSKEGQKG